MSGRLVGEVIDNARRLKAAGLSDRGLTALIVIAESCREDTRQGRVWLPRVAGLLGDKDNRTATRALADVRAAGLAKIIEPGKLLGDIPNCGKCRDHRLNHERWQQHLAARSVLPPLCGQCDAKDGDPVSARIVWLDPDRAGSKLCPRCHPKVMARPRTGRALYQVTDTFGAVVRW